MQSLMPPPLGLASVIVCRDLELSEDALRLYPPGPALQVAAELSGRDLRDVMKVALQQPMDLPIMMKKTKAWESKLWLPGHAWKGTGYGPTRRHQVMIVGKLPGREELAIRRNFSGRSGDLMANVVANLGVDASDWYCTNAVRYADPDNASSLSQQHIKACQPLLMQEFAMVKPRYLLLLGADAVKAFYGKTPLSRVRSHVHVIRTLADLGGDPRPIEACKPEETAAGTLVFAANNPAAVLHESGLIEGFRADMQAFCGALRGAVHALPSDEGLEYYYVRNPADAAALVAGVRGLNPEFLSVDCEWGLGDYRTGKLRSIQVSWAPKRGVAFVLCAPGGGETMSPAEKAEFVGEIRKLFLGGTRLPKIIGHNFREDARWLREIGIDLVPQLHADTMLMDHCVVHENSEHGLDALAIRYTDLGRYDIPLATWLRDNGIVKDVLDRRGYIDPPDELLLPYAIKDSDATLRSFLILESIAKRPENDEVRKLFYEVIMPCSLPIHEMEMTGMPIDPETLQVIEKRAADRRRELAGELRRASDRPQFNPDSPDQVAAFLFGSKVDGGLGLTPYKTTGKQSKMWASLRDDEKAKMKPSTDGETLEYLAGKHAFVDLLIGYRTVAQLCKTFVPEPGSDEEGGEVYEKGLLHYLSSDGRIHPSIGQMTETGRHSTRDPNVQNWPKKTEKEIARLLGADVPTIRSALKAPPGYVLVMVDFESAELFTLAEMSGDMMLLRELPADLHARGAVKNFGAPKWDGFESYIKPPKTWRKAYEDLRIAQKTLNFGIPYGRGNSAIAREIERETKNRVRCTPDKAQELIDDFMTRFKQAGKYIELCHELAVTKGVITNAYGRRRRWNPTDDEVEQAAKKREFVNFPIQGTVADLLNTCLVALYRWERAHPWVDMKMVIAIHDAVAFLVKGEFAELVVRHAIPECLSQTRVPRWLPRHDWPSRSFSLGIDPEVTIRWGVEPDVIDLIDRGVSASLASEFSK